MHYYVDAAALDVSDVCTVDFTEPITSRKTIEHAVVELIVIVTRIKKYSYPL